MKKISCFSYKGGAGRSTLALNVVPYLADMLNASSEHPLILVDMDVDSCGITYFFNLQDDENTKNYSVQSLFGSYGAIPQEDVKSIRDHRLFRHLCPVGDWFNYDPEAILCLPANPGNALGGSNNYDGSRSQQLQDFIDECEHYDCCGILFDSAVGDQLTANWSNYYADQIMCVMRPTKQFREGTDRFLDIFDERIARNKKILIIPNVVPTEALTLEDRDGTHSYPEYAKTKILDSFGDKFERNGNHYDLSMLEGNLFGVPKIDRFMWQEGILRTVSKLTETERIALERYKKIAEIICKD